MKSNVIPKSVYPTSQKQVPGPVLSPLSYFQSESPAVSGKDIRYLDFEESMPILLRLSREPSFVDEMRKVQSLS